MRKDVVCFILGFFNRQIIQGVQNQKDFAPLFYLLAVCFILILFAYELQILYMVHRIIKNRTA